MVKVWIGEIVSIVFVSALGGGISDGLVFLDRPDVSAVQKIGQTVVIAG